ncbi:hypothetical protein ACFLXU_02005 [Chloroflexota bacterium]
MQWYWDSSHYKKELGDLMLDKIFNYHESGRIVPDNFGVLITSDNIERHLEKSVLTDNITVVPILTISLKLRSWLISWITGQ